MRLYNIGPMIIIIFTFVVQSTIHTNINFENVFSSCINISSSGMVFLLLIMSVAVYEKFEIFLCKCVIVLNMFSHVHSLSDGYPAHTAS